MSHIACSSASLRPELGRSVVGLRRPTSQRGAAVRPARAASVEVSNSSSEARAWIDAWRAKQTQPDRASDEQALRAGISLQLQKSAAAKEREERGTSAASDAAPGATSNTEETLEAIMEESIATQRRMREQTAAIAATALQAAMAVQLHRSKGATPEHKEVPEELLRAAVQPSSPEVQKRLREQASAAPMPEDVMKAAINRQLERSGDPMAPPNSEGEGITAELMSSIEIQDRLRDELGAMSDAIMQAAINRQLENSKMADDFGIEESPSPLTREEREAASVHAQARLRDGAAALADEVVKAAIARQLASSPSGSTGPALSDDTDLTEEEAEEVDPFKDSIEVQEGVREKAAMLAEDIVKAAITRQLLNSAAKPRSRKDNEKLRKASMQIQDALRKEATVMSEEVMAAAISRQLRGTVPTASAPQASDTAQASASASSSGSSSSSSSPATAKADGDMITYTAEQLDAISLEDALKNLKP